MEKPDASFMFLNYNLISQSLAVVIIHLPRCWLINIRTSLYVLSQLSPHQIDVFSRVLTSELELVLEVLIRGEKATEDEFKEAMSSLVSGSGVGERCLVNVAPIAGDDDHAE